MCLSHDPFLIPSQSSTSSHFTLHKYNHHHHQILPNQTREGRLVGQTTANSKKYTVFDEIDATGVLEKQKEVQTITRVGTNDEDDAEFYGSEFDFDEDVNFKRKGKNIIIDGDISNELFERMQGDEGDDDCAESDELGGAFDSEEEDPQKFLMYEDSENHDFKLGMIFNSRKEAKFEI